MNRPDTKAVTWNAGSSLTDSVANTGNAKHMGAVLPANFTQPVNNVLSFQVCAEGETTWQNLYNDAGLEVYVTLPSSAASKSVSFGIAALDLAPWPLYKIRSGTAASATAQVGTTASCVTTVATGKTLTFSAMYGTLANTLTVDIDIAEDDTLAVTGSGSTILIKLANTTGSKNSAANIQTALRAISGGKVNGVTITGATVVGNAAYNAEPLTGALAGTEAEVVLTPATGKTLTIGSGLAGSNYNALKFAVATAEDDNLAVAESEGTITISLANSTASNNAASAIQTAVRALSVSGYTMTAFTVEANAAYTSAPPIAGTVAATNMAGGDANVITDALENGADTIAKIALKA